MKKFLLVSCVILAASPAFACKYVRLEMKAGMATAKIAELQKDQRTIDDLRQAMSTVCTTTKTAAINSCQHSKGMCADLPYELQSKFQYDVGADGEFRGMVSPEERTKYAAIIDGLYKK
ncbi:MAG: hypothetical protein ACOYJ2_07985 [Rickettsiales bacterium]